jgi:hypothetical protein
VFSLIDFHGAGMVESLPKRAFKKSELRATEQILQPHTMGESYDQLYQRFFFIFYQPKIVLIVLWLKHHSVTIVGERRCAMFADLFFLLRQFCIGFLGRVMLGIDV